MLEARIISKRVLTSCVASTARCWKRCSREDMNSKRTTKAKYSLIEMAKHSFSSWTTLEMTERSSRYSRHFKSTKCLRKNSNSGAWKKICPGSNERESIWLLIRENQPLRNWIKVLTLSISIVRRRTSFIKVHAVRPRRGHHRDGRDFWPVLVKPRSKKAW